MMCFSFLRKVSWQTAYALSVSLMLMFSVGLEAKEKSRCIKIIPIVKFESDNFDDLIEMSFQHPYHYLSIIVQGRDTTYTVNYYGRELNKSKWTRILEYDKLAFLRKPLHINTDLLFKNDSICFVYLAKSYNNYRPFQPNYFVYGIKKNGRFLFSLTDGSQPLMSFGDVIMHFFGSMNSFYRTYMEIKEEELRKAQPWIMLVPTHLSDILSIIQTDYAYYAIANPTDSVGIRKRYYENLQTLSGLSNDSLHILREAIEDFICHNTPDPYTDFHMSYAPFMGLFGERSVLFGYEVGDVIRKVLTPSQYAVFRNENEMYQLRRQECLLELMRRLKLRPVNELKRKGREIEKNMAILNDYLNSSSIQCSEVLTE